MDTSSNEISDNGNKGVGWAVLFLGIVAIVNIVFIIGAGFSGEEGLVLFGQNLPLKTLILISAFSFICNLYASVKIKWMVLFGGLILAVFPLLFSLNALTTPTERHSLMTWLSISFVVYFASFIGGLLGLQINKSQW